MASPSNYRKNGRNDFCPDCDPADSYRGMVGSSNWHHYLKGWNQAKEEYEKEQEKEENNPFKDLLIRIGNLNADPEIIDVLEDIIELIEERL